VSTAQTSARDEGPRTGVVLAGLVGLTLASLEWRGWRFGIGNQSIQVALLKHILDPSLYARDPLVSSFQGYASYFFKIASLLVRLLHGVEPSVLLQALDGDHIPALQVLHGLAAGVDRLAVDQDRAGPAVALATPVFGSRQAKLRPEHPQQVAVPVHIEVDLGTVKAK